MAKLKEEILNLILNVKGDNARKEINDTINAISDGKAKVKEMKSEMRDLAKQGQTNSTRYKELAKAVKDESAALERNKKKLEEQRSKLSLNDMTVKELSQRIKSLNRQMEQLRPESKEWKALNRELQSTSARMRQLKNDADGTSKALSALSKAQAAVGAAVAAVYGVARAFGSAFNTIKDFEQANVNLATILGKNVGEIAALTEEAERLGRTTEYTASEVTGLQIELAKLGFTEGQIQGMEEYVLNFATAVGTDLSSAAALAGSTLRMFGLSTKDTEDVLATLALATNKSALSFSFFETAMSTVGPVANTFGFSLKDTTALLGSLANAGFDASSAAVATRNILLNLANANGKLAKSLGEPVRSFDDLMKGLQKLEDQGIDLAGALELTNARSVAAFTTFLHGTDAAAELRGELENTDGVLKDIAEQRMNTLEGSLKKLSSAWEGFILKMKNSTGVLKSVVDWLTEIVSLITPGSRHNADVETAVSTITAGYGTAEGRASVAEQKVNELQAKLDKLDEDFENASDRRSKRRINKEKKRVEKEISVYRDAYSRLRSEADIETESQGAGALAAPGSPLPPTPPGGGGNGGSGKGGNGAKKTWSLASDLAYLAERAAITKKFNEGELKTQEEFEEALYQLEVKTMTDRIASRKDSAAERQKIESDLLSKIADHTKKERAEVLKLEEQANQTRLAAATDYNKKADLQVKAEEARYEKEKAQYEAKKDSIEDYQQLLDALDQKNKNNLLKIELDRVTAEHQSLEAEHKIILADIKKRYEHELQLESTSSARKLEIQRDRNKKIAEENLRFLEQQYDFLKKVVGTETLNEVKLTKEQLEKYKVQLAEIWNQLQAADAEVVNLTTSSAFKGTGDASLFGVTQKDWEQFFANLKDGTLKAKDLQTAINGIGGMAQEGFKLASQAIQLTNAKEKKELDDYKEGQESMKKALKERYDAGLMSEAQYNEEMEKMEASAKAKQEEMELKQAKRAKAMAIVQSIIDTALAVSKTLAQGGLMFGLPAAPIVAALGAAQTAMIIAQPVGYAEGGEVQVQRAQDGRTFRAKVAPGKRGYVNRPTVLVGEEGGEYVIPAEGLKNPDIRLMADTIEKARRRGTLRNIRMEAVSPEMVISGRSRGGYVTDRDTEPAAEKASSVLLSAGLLWIQSCSPKVIHHTEIEYRDRYVRDSLYFRDSVFVKEQVKGDTVFQDKYVYKYIYKEKVRTDTLVREVRDTTICEVKVEKPLSMAQKAKIGAFWWLVLGLAGCLGYIFRKPLLNLLK